MFDITTLFKAFLGANTERGFVSFFGDSYRADEGWRAYIIKGGPGTGKSSMMKQLAAFFAEKGEKIELCPCSSDPDSLDAVIFHGKKTVILDGTAPHTVDPVFPGAVEKIVNLSDCWNDGAFKGKEQEIIALTRENKALHAAASRYITAAGSLLSQNRKTAAAYVDKDKIKRYVNALCRRMLSEGTAAREEKRFLSGVTPKGLLFLKQSIAPHYKTVIALEDEYGAVARVFFSHLRERCLAEKQSIITCFNTVNPDVIDHILLPEQGIAFCSENRYTHPEGITRRIHARRFTDTVSLSAKRQKMTFNRRAAEELLREAVSVIAEAKRTHDKLEKYYIDAMDFTKVGDLAAKIAGEMV
ncbi:MAG: hypothetical protein IJ426_00950 [Clostridia bacterium]|nr:hypothetical protein [Clostridia bacterium]